MTKNFSDARKILLKAFEGYIQHNQRQLDGFIPHSPYQPAFTFFEMVLGKHKPKPGFKDWICCHYYCLLKCVLTPFGAGDPLGYFLRFAYPFEEIKWWRGWGISDYEEEPNHTAPKTVLHNLNALFNVLNFHMEKRYPQLAQIKIERNYQENDLTAIKYAPLSVQIYKTFENLKLRMQFAESIMEQNAWVFGLAYKTLEKATSAFEGYTKGIAVRELRAILVNQHLGDKEAVQAVEAQLKNGITFLLFKKNRQSELEKDLKLLSLITMFIGIGIFTTLGLIGKRLYDSGGKSINFFKPLSQNLHETIECITLGLEEIPKSANAANL
jgi:hypothetical protein